MNETERVPRLLMVPAVDHWPAILPGLEAMRATGADWTPDDLLKLCEDRYAALFIAPGDDGFCILAARMNPETGGTQMAILAACGKVGETDEYRAEIIDLARVIDAVEIVNSETKVSNPPLRARRGKRQCLKAQLYPKPRTRRRSPPCRLTAG